MRKLFWAALVSMLGCQPSERAAQAPPQPAPSVVQKPWKNCVEFHMELQGKSAEDVRRILGEPDTVFSTYWRYAERAWHPGRKTFVTLWVWFDGASCVVKCD